MTNKRILSPNLNVIMALGSVWGLSEVMMGMWLHRCAHLYTGAIMTGLAFFYISFVWTLDRKIISVVLLLILASLFKMLDALLLSEPILSGSVANPIFAFFLEASAFILIVLLIRNRFMEKRNMRIMTGTGSSLLALSVFPVVGFFTGAAACMYPGTQVPLSIATAPVAMLISAVTVPLGYVLAEKYMKVDPVGAGTKLGTIIRYAWSPLIILLCFSILTISRIV